MDEQTPKPLTPAERMALRQAQANQLVRCEKCGGTWFAEATYQQYNGSLYSSTPGGDMSPVSVMPQTIRVCLCGNPIAPKLGGIRGGRTANAEMASFFDSLNAAKEYLAEVAEGKTAVGKVINAFSPREDVEKIEAQLQENLKLKETVAGLAQRLEIVEGAVTAPEEEPKPAKKGGKA